MNERNFAEQNKILEYPVGSHLYGTNTPTSDEDFAGVFIAPLEYYFGMKKVEEVDLSIVSKLENGKNAPDAIDRKFYEIRKFMKLAMECNPNIAEMLYCPQDKLIFSNEIGQELIKHREIFLHKGLYDKFIGYAKSQLHKMRIKPENYSALEQFKKNYDFQMFNPNALIVEYKETDLRFGPSYGITFSKDFCSIGDLNFNLTRKMKDVYSSVCERISKAGSRTELFTKYGYDVKFGMNCCRLLLEGFELLETGNLEFPLKFKDVLLQIRNGEYNQEQLMKMIEAFQERCEESYNNSKLPEKPRYDEVEDLLMKLTMKFHGVN